MKHDYSLLLQTPCEVEPHVLFEIQKVLPQLSLKAWQVLLLLRNSVSEDILALDQAKILGGTSPRLFTLACRRADFSSS